MGTDLYIYYRVGCDRSQALQTQVVAMQAALSLEYGIETALKRRPEETDGRHTWMEIYVSVPQGFDAILKQAVDQAGLPSLIDGERHTEHFLDFSSCA